MENLTNEQIIDIINFYKMCGISEDMYLSRNGVLDIFSLIGISPDFDEQGNRLPTVYEQLSIAPIFRDGKEVPIVFAIKHKVSKIYKPKADDKIKSEKYTFGGVKEQVSDKIVLNKLKQDYFSAVVNGNLSEASRIYDLIDKITGGKADFFIGIQFNCVKFYKKMQKQLLIDMFANFIILMILSKKKNIRAGIIKFDKLYKAFIQKQIENGNFGLIQADSVKIPEIKNITVSVSESEKIKGVNVRADVSKDLKQKQQVNLQNVENKQTLASFVKEKINVKINKLKTTFSEMFFLDKINNKENDSAPKFSTGKKVESMTNILESD